MGNALSATLFSVSEHTMDKFPLDFSLITHYAFRYALDRDTSAPKHVSDFVTAHISEISARTLVLMIMEIDACRAKGGLRAENAQAWATAFREVMATEIRRRYQTPKGRAHELIRHFVEQYGPAGDKAAKAKAAQPETAQ